MAAGTVRLGFAVIVAMLVREAAGIAMAFFVAARRLPVIIAFGMVAVVA